MNAELKTDVLERVLEDMESDYETGEDFGSVLKPSYISEVCRDEFGHCPSAAECQEIGDDAKRIFWSRHDDADEALERGLAHTASELAELEAEMRGSKPEKKSVQKNRPKGPKMNRPRRATVRSAERWVIHPNYPNYEISTHARMRAVNRAKPEDCLKPKIVWFGGKATIAYRLVAPDGGRPVDRFVGPLMVRAGVLNRPKWMKSDE